MSEKLKESLSAAVDDEADEFELRRVLDELERDPELRSLWERYHLFGSVLRGEMPASSVSLRDRVWDSLEGEFDRQEPTLALAASAPAIGVDQPSGSLLSRKMGLGLAASVAFAVGLGIAVMNGSDDVAPQQVVQVDAPSLPVVAPLVEESVLVPSSDIRLAADASPSDLRRARAYMLHHAQQQALNQAGVVNFVKMATYENP